MKENYDIEKLKSIEQSLSSNKSRQINIPIDNIEYILNMVKNCFKNEEILLEISAPLNILGDIHGQQRDLQQIFSVLKNPSESKFLFLGDQVDRGLQSVEVIILLFVQKVMYNESFWLLRGNHEVSSINYEQGFQDEVKRRYNLKLWKTFNDVFDWLPLSAVVDRSILCMHGGLSPKMTLYSQIKGIKRPLDPEQDQIANDLLWSDPTAMTETWTNSDRGVSYLFGKKALNEFLKKNDLDLICRAHQVVEKGQEFFNGRKLVTVFSAPNYQGLFGNMGAILQCDKNLVCNFRCFKSNENSSPQGMFAKNAMNTTGVNFGNRGRSKTPIRKRN